MSDMPKTYQPLFKKMARFTKTARVRLIWERYVPTLARALLASAAFLTTTYLGVWERLGDPWRLIALIATLSYIAHGVWKALSLTWPNASDARRRVEIDSGQSHRPLDTLDDRPALSKEVWPSHYQKALRQAEKITAPKGRPALANIDPYYLRYIAPAALIAASIYIAGFGTERLRYVMSPTWQSGINPSKVKFEAWIDPPAYTGRPPIYFKDRTEIDVPAGSEFVIRASGAKNITRPKLSHGLRSRFLPIKRLGTKSFEARTDITASTTAEWRIGTRRQSWDLNVQPDLPPKIEIIDPPEADKRDRLAFTYALEDDYGVEDLRLEMVELYDGLSPQTAFDGDSEFAVIALSSSAVKKADKASAAVDLTKHILAGRKVIGRLVATDGRGQRAMSESVYFTVPDKIFIEPLAKAVAENRTLIMAAKGEDYAPEIRRTTADGYWNQFEPNQRMTRAPESIQRAALLIEAVTDIPDRLFTDPTVYIGLRNVRAQLRYADSTDDLRGLPETLWKIALRAEFGVLGTALEEMREAQEALAEGLARRAPQREIDTLFERYNQAVDAYTEELRRKAIEEGNFADEDGGGGGGTPPLESVDEIQELLKLIEEANKVGDVEGARKALARLNELLEQLQIQLSKGGGGSGGDGGGGELSEEEQEALEDLAETIGEQRDLQDETRQAERAEQDRENGNDTSESESLSPEELAQRQAELEQLLDQLEDAIPDSLGQGEGPVSAGEGEDPSDAGQQGQDQDGQSGSDDGNGQSGSGEQPNGNNQGNGQEGGQGDNQDGTQGGGRSAQGSETGQGPGGSQTIDEAIASARRAMRESRESLENGDLSGARQTQGEVIAELRRAGEAIAEAANSSEDGEGSGEGGGEGNDPLGRADGDGLNNDSDTDIDTRDNATRSRELLEELRRRAAQQGRSPEELEYLERLLKRF
ncbi:MAG: DUF4175 family protein [Litorimonas sp.]